MLDVDGHGTGPARGEVVGADRERVGVTTLGEAVAESLPQDGEEHPTVDRVADQPAVGEVPLEATLRGALEREELVELVRHPGSLPEAQSTATRWAGTKPRCATTCRVM